MNKAIKRNLLIVLTLLIAAVALLGFTGIKAKASTIDDFEFNMGEETDFKNTLGKVEISTDVLGGDKTLVRFYRNAGSDPTYGWGWRVTNNYRQQLDGATFDADVYLQGANSLPTIYYGINPSGGAPGEYWDGGGLNIFFNELDENTVEVKVGWWKMNYGMVPSADPAKSTFYGSKAVTVNNGVLNVKSELVQNDDLSWTLTLVLDGTDFVVDIPQASWTANSDNDTGYLGVGLIHNQFDPGNVCIVFNDYNDRNRTRYFKNEDLADAFEALDDLKMAYLVSRTFGENTSIENASSLLSQVTAQRSTVVTNDEVRFFEKGRANWYFNETKKILDEIFEGDDTGYGLEAIRIAVDAFSAAIEKTVTETELAAAETLRQGVDYDKLSAYEENGTAGASEIMDKYIAARNKLNDKRDGFVNEHLTAFENAVKDLSTNEKIAEAADLQKEVIIANAKTANRDGYTQRYNKASETLIGKIAKYAGGLVNAWNIHNVTFIKTNDAREIEYSASDYYDNNSANDVGCTLKSKVKLEGLSLEFTVHKGDYNRDSWFGVFVTKENTIFASQTETETGLRESRGVITLIKPFAADPSIGLDAYTQVRMGYPNLYGNEVEGNECYLTADLYGNRIKMEFTRESDDGEDYYVCYITVTDDDGEVLVERFAARKMLAAIVDAELDDDGMGYLTFGSCDKTLVGLEATIHTINGKAAANYPTDYVDVPIDPDDNQGGGDNQDNTNKTDDTEKTKKGCGCKSIAGGAAYGTVATLLLGGTAVLLSLRKKEDKEV